MSQWLRCALGSLIFAVAPGGADAPGAETAGPAYLLAGTLHRPGSVRWDYLTFDGAAHRLLVTRGTSVEALDMTTGAVVGTLAGLKGVHGVALAPELGRGFVSDGVANAVVIFDLASLAPVATVPTGIKPDAVAYDPASRRVFAANGGSGTLTAIDGASGAVVGTIALGGQPEFAVVDGRGRLYVNLEDRAQVAAVDTAALTVLAHHDLAPACLAPTGLAIDTVGNRLFVTCRNRVMVVVEAATGRVAASLPIGAGSDAALFDPGPGLAFSSNGDGTLTVVDATDPARYRVVQTVTTVPSARTMALDPASHRLYLAAAGIDGPDPSSPPSPHPRPRFKPDSFMILTVDRPGITVPPRP